MWNSCGLVLSSHWDEYRWQIQHTQSQDNISVEQGISLDQVQSRDMTNVWSDLVRANVSVGERCAYKYE